MKTIKYQSTNGYTGILCTKDGKSELVIFNQELKEVLCMASPVGNTTDWLVNTVEGMPKVMEGEKGVE